MYSLVRLLFRKLHGKPKAQMVVGIIMIPVGILISIAALIGNNGYIYPYWIVAGIALAIVGIVLIVRGAKALGQAKPAVQQAAYGVAPGQYAPQQPYGQPQSYGQPQAPYGQPSYPPPYPSEQMHAPYEQPQTPYGQPSYPPPYTPGQPQQ